MQDKSTAPIHAFVVLVIVLSATILRGLNDLDTQTLSTVYGAGLGFASGLAVSTSTKGNGN